MAPVAPGSTPSTRTTRLQAFGGRDQLLAGHQGFGGPAPVTVAANSAERQAGLVGEGPHAHPVGHAADPLHGFCDGLHGPNVYARQGGKQMRKFALTSRDY